MQLASLQIQVKQPTPGDAPAITGTPATQAPAAPGAVLDFIASDETLDRYGEVISAAGWRLEAYRRNPVFQNAHQYGDILFTLGRALITEVRHPGPGTGGTPGTAGAPHLFQRIQFATEVNPVARIAFGLYKARFLNAVSVGFIPLRWLDGDGAEHTLRAHGGAAGAREPHRGVPPTGTGVRRRYLEQELLEVSAVGIPANPNALALGLREGVLARADLAEALAMLRVLAARPRPADSLNRPAPGSRRHWLDFARELHRVLRRA